MPTLLEINITCNQGSTGKIAEQIGLAMQRRGWKVYYAHGARKCSPSALQTFSFSNLPAEIMHYAKSRILDGDGRGSRLETLRLIKFIKRIQPDVVHIHNVHGYYLNYPLLFDYLNQNGIKTILTLHDCWTFTGHCTHFMLNGCNKWKTHCNTCEQIHQNPKRSIVDRSKQNFDLKRKYFANPNIGIICVSDWLASNVKESFLAQNYIQTIHNGIDLSVFKPYNRKSDTKKFRILGVAFVWNKDKGLEDIIKLREMLPTDMYEIVLVGLTKSQLKQLPPSIVGLPGTSNPTELAQIYSDSDILINPTYADTFPTINLEAIACGTPVITYNTGGSPESITDATGIVVEKGDINALAKAITALKNNPLNRNICREYAMEYFDKDRCFQAYCNLFENLN